MCRTHATRERDTETKGKTVTKPIRIRSYGVELKPKPSAASTNAANATCATVFSFDTISGFIGIGLPDNHDTITAATIMMSHHNTKITNQRGTQPPIANATWIETR